MCCSYFESVFLPATLAINCNPTLELKAKQEYRKELILCLKLIRRTVAKNIHINYNILSINKVVCLYCREKYYN